MKGLLPNSMENCEISVVNIKTTSRVYSDVVLAFTVMAND